MAVLLTDDTQFVSQGGPTALEDCTGGIMLAGCWQGRRGPLESWMLVFPLFTTIAVVKATLSLLGQANMLIGSLKWPTIEECR